MTERRGAVVVGAGAAGLAAAAELGRAGVDTVVLEREATVGARWRTRYDRLRLHTVRRLSGLPGYAMPRAYGRWPSRDDVVAYLEEYARRHALDVRLETPAERIERSAGAWRVRTPEGALDADRVVVATGYSARPHVPDWPGRGGFAGELLHSSAYRNPGPFVGREVLVVGSGNSGAEIAVDLADGGARRVRLAVRTPPQIVRRDRLGLPSQVVGIAIARLPAPAADRVGVALRRLTIPDLAPFGLPRPETPPVTDFAARRQIPILDVGIVDAVRDGRVEVVPAVTALDGRHVLLADGRRLAPDAVVAATGYRPALEPLVGHLGVLDDRGLPRGPEPEPGLHFLGFVVTLGGMLRRVGLDARALARTVETGRVAGRAAGT